MFTKHKIGKWSPMSDKRIPAVIRVLSELATNKSIRVDEELLQSNYDNGMLPNCTVLESFCKEMKRQGSLDMLHSCLQHSES